MTKTTQLDFINLRKNIAACRHCMTCTPPLPHQPRPVVVGTQNAKIRIIGQAPGTRVHASGIPFDDPSGDRLRDWLGVDKVTFYNEDIFAITPMGFCFPGLDAKGGDIPPRKECAPLWMDKLDAAFTNVELTLLVGMYAQKHVLKDTRHRTLTETVKHWRDYAPNTIPLPHPSWRNNGWIKKHDWFPEILDTLKTRVTAPNLKATHSRIFKLTQQQVCHSPNKRIRSIRTAFHFPGTH